MDEKERKDIWKEIYAGMKELGLTKDDMKGIITDLFGTAKLQSKDELHRLRQFVGDVRTGCASDASLAVADAVLTLSERYKEMAKRVSVSGPVDVDYEAAGGDGTVRNDMIDNAAIAAIESFCSDGLLTLDDLSSYVKVEFGVMGMKELTTGQAKDLLAEVKSYSRLLEGKCIDIDWENVPTVTLVQKLNSALKCSAGDVIERAFGTHLYQVTCEGRVHKASISSCDCEDWKRNGSSINPCKHMVRIKYTDDEIKGMLEKLGGMDMKIVKHKTDLVRADVDELPVEYGSKGNDCF